MEKRDLKKEKKEFIDSCMVNDILSIDKLIESKDFKLIKQSIYSLPIDLYELLHSYYDKKEYRRLFEFAVDHKFSYAKEFANRNIIKEAPNVIYKMFLEFKDSIGLRIKFNVNKKYIQYPNELKYERAITQIEKTLKETKDKIIQELSYEIDKDKLTGDLTKEYFLNLLNDSNKELIVIKLYVKLESILKFDYHYEGTFEEMLNTYIDKNCLADDGWGYIQENKYANLLHRLRIHRNGIVHAKNCSSKLTLDELVVLVDYICELG